MKTNWQRYDPYKKQCTFPTSCCHKGNSLYMTLWLCSVVTLVTGKALWDCVKPVQFSVCAWRLELAITLRVCLLMLKSSWSWCKFHCWVYLHKSVLPLCWSGPLSGCSWSDIAAIGSMESWVAFCQPESCIFSASWWQMLHHNPTASPLVQCVLLHDSALHVNRSEWDDVSADPWSRHVHVLSPAGCAPCCVLGSCLAWTQISAS